MQVLPKLLFWKFQKRLLEQIFVEDLRRNASVSKFYLKVSAEGNYLSNINWLNSHRWKFMNNTLWTNGHVQHFVSKKELSKSRQVSIDKNLFRIYFIWLYLVSKGGKKVKIKWLICHSCTQNFLKSYPYRDIDYLRNINVN